MSQLVDINMQSSGGAGMLITYTTSQNY